VAALLLALFAALSALAADLQPVPPFGARVTDLTHTLSSAQVQTLTDELEALEKRKGSRVAILMVPSTEPEAIEQYSIRVTDSWLLSRNDNKHTQDGVLLLVAKDDHRVRIDVGRDLEGAITDVASSRIIREYITPKFRSGDYYGGIHDALEQLTKLIDGESLPPPLSSDDQRARGGKHHDFFSTFGIAVFLLVWARGFFSWLPSTPRALTLGGLAGGGAWLLSGLLPLAIGLGVLGLIIGWLGGSGGNFIGRGGRGGGWTGGLGGGGWGGGSWGGGGGGGGFSGGSSGGFSGGGASGSW
jgi:uncharacterized protein